MGLFEKQLSQYALANASGANPLHCEGVIPSYLPKTIIHGQSTTKTITGKNLFNIETASFKHGTARKEDNGFSFVNYYSEIYIPLEPGTYTISYKVVGLHGNARDYWSAFTIYAGKAKTKTLTSISYGYYSGTFTLTEDVDGFITLYGRLSCGIHVYDIQIETGSMVTEYEPYGEVGTTYTVATNDIDMDYQIAGKNLFNIKLLEGISNVFKTEEGYYEVRAYPINLGWDSLLIQQLKRVLKPGVTYTLSKKVNAPGASSGSIWLRHRTDNVVTLNYNKSSVTFSLTQEQIDSITNIYIYGSSTQNIADGRAPTIYEYIQLEIGDVATEYEPYHCTSYFIPHKLDIPTGKNLCDTNYFMAHHSDGLSYPYIPIFVGKGNYITMSVENPPEVGSVSAYVGITTNRTNALNFSGNSTTFLYHKTLRSNKSIVVQAKEDWVWVQISGWSEYLLACGNLQVELGKQATEFEPTVTEPFHMNLSKGERLEFDYKNNKILYYYKDGVRDCTNDWWARDFAPIALTEKQVNILAYSDTYSSQIDAQYLIRAGQDYPHIEKPNITIIDVPPEYQVITDESHIFEVVNSEGLEMIIKGGS